MGPPLQKIRGFPDQMPPAARLRRKIISKAYETGARFGFEPVETPVAEYEEVFRRALHESSSVSKEMYFIEGAADASAALASAGASESAAFSAGKSPAGAAGAAREVAGASAESPSAAMRSAAMRSAEIRSATGRASAERFAESRSAGSRFAESRSAAARRIVLRPEGTAAIARLFVEQKLRPQQRFIYSGPMFRRERPQKGRFRQFTTIAAEIFGENDALSDAETLSLAWIFLKELGVCRKISLEINTIGSQTERKVYIEKLISFLKPLKNRLSGESQARLDSNPLRILDSKNEEDKEALKQAPLITDCLSEESRNRFQETTAFLRDLRIPWTENPFLVRGLDYYNHLVFEVKAAGLGAQDAVLAGGRYDDLTEALGGPRVPALGWGAGVERLALLLEEEAPPPPDAALIAVGAAAQKKAFLIAHRLRESGRRVFFRFSGNFSKQTGRAAGKGAAAALIFGEKEVQSGSVTVKNLKTGEQRLIKEEGLEAFLRDLLEKKR